MDTATSVVKEANAGWKSVGKIAVEIGLARETLRSTYGKPVRREKFYSFEGLAASNLGEVRAAYVGSWLFFRRRETLLESLSTERREIWVRIHPATREEIEPLTSLLRSAK